MTIAVLVDAQLIAEAERLRTQANKCKSDAERIVRRASEIYNAANEWRGGERNE
jgi:hypothetical protein